MLKVAWIDPACPGPARDIALRPIGHGRSLFLQRIALEFTASWSWPPGARKRYAAPSPASASLFLPRKPPAAWVQRPSSPGPSVRQPVWVIAGAGPSVSCSE